MTTWILSDGAAGNENQALALAAALGLAAPKVWRLRARRPWNWLAPQWAPVLSAAQWTPPLAGSDWPDLAIGAGRTGAAALLSIKRLSAGRTRTVQILDPRVASDRFDLVLVPAHDQVRGDNIIAVDGAIHTVTADWLAQIRRENPATAPAPRAVLLVGGPRRGVAISQHTFERMRAELGNWQSTTGGSLQIIGSRRTPRHWRGWLETAALKANSQWFDAGDGDNPYRAALAWGDRFYVSGDSINMLSEAMGTGRPVFAVCNGIPKGKIGRFHQAMHDSGRLHALGATAVGSDYPPLRELERITPELRRRLGLS